MDDQYADRLPCALTVAGSDSGAGAGIQADLKTFAAHGVFACTVLTLVTAQNTQGVSQVEILAPELVTSQLEAVFSDFAVAALKTGALGNARVIAAVAEFLMDHVEASIVADPVMVSKHGHPLIDAAAIPLMLERLLPLCTVVTPNLAEAALLAGMPVVASRQEMQQAAQRIADFGPQAVVVKGGHAQGEPVDLLFCAGTAHWLTAERVDSPHTHGTGCTFSAAITANLALGLELHPAVAAAKEYVTHAIAHGQRYGRGINPVNHFWRWQMVN